MVADSVRRSLSNGTVYRRETPSDASAWVAHVAWYEAGKRRQMKRAFRTKKDAQASLVELLAAHQTGRFVESSKLTVRGFADAWLDGLANQGRKATTLNGYRRIIDSYVAPRLGDVACRTSRHPTLTRCTPNCFVAVGRTVVACR